MKKLSMLLSGSLRLWRHLVCYLRYSLRKSPLRIKSDIKIEDTVLVSVACPVHRTKIPIEYMFQTKLF
jgi:hypothetical protein